MTLRHYSERPGLHRKGLDRRKELRVENQIQKITNFFNLMGKIVDRYSQGITEAQRNFFDQNQKAMREGLAAKPFETPNPWLSWNSYLTDSFQRSVLFWDVIRQRGNVFLDHERAGKPPVLAYKYEMVMDGRRFEHPVNYALVRIVLPEGVKTDDSRRPCIIVDPRAGHGPGIGGFKEDSEVGDLFQAGHPVYFVMFFPDSEPGQTLLDVCAAEARFVRVVAERHPESEKPVIYGNCQAGWAVHDACRIST